VLGDDPTSRLPVMLTTPQPAPRAITRTREVAVLPRRQDHLQMSKDIQLFVFARVFSY